MTHARRERWEFVGLRLSPVVEEAAPRLATRIDITHSPPDGSFTVLPDGPVDHPAVVVVEGERIVGVRERQVGPRFDDLLWRQPETIHAGHHRADGEARPDDHGLATADARPPFNVRVVAPIGPHRGNRPGPACHANTLSGSRARSPIGRRLRPWPREAERPGCLARKRRNAGFVWPRVSFGGFDGGLEPEPSRRGALPGERSPSLAQ